MKKFLRIILISLLFIAGCEEDETWLVSSDDGPMVIEKICDPSNWDAPITAVAIDQVIKVSGKNLANIDTIMINDVGVSYPGDAFLVNGVLYVRVPYVVPVEIDNKIKLTDKEGRTVSAALTVSIPDLKITGMECEYIADGGELVIQGDYFDLWGFGDPDETESGPDERVVKIGDKQAEIITASKTSITVLVPDGTAANSKVSIENEFTNSVLGGAVDCPGYFRDSKWLLENFSWDLNSNGVREIIIPPVDPSSGNPEPVADRYFRYKGTYSAWAWDGISYKNPFPGGAPDDLNTNPGKYAIKFEIWAGSQMLGNNLAFFFNGQSNVIRVGKDESIPVGKWVTVTIPCTTFSSPNGFAPAFEFVMHGGDTVPMDFALDNIRFSEYD